MHTQRAPQALPTLLPPGVVTLVVTFNSFLKPTQLPGEMQPVQQICATHSAKSITISALTGTHLPLGGENQLQCLAQGHNCHDWDSNPHSHKQKHQGPIS